MLMSLGCIELVVLWLAQSDLPHGSEYVGWKCSLCPDGVYSVCIFLMVLLEEQVPAFT